jgi:hypothetical protein
LRGVKGRKLKRQRKSRAKPKVFKPTVMDIIATPFAIVFSCLAVLIAALIIEALK